MGFITGLVTKAADIFVPYGGWGLFLYAFIEASVFPLPVETLLIPLMLVDTSKALWFAMIATIGSVIGAIFGYYLGYIGKMVFLERFFSEGKIAKIHKLYNKYEGWAVFIAGFTPVPFKLVTISGGAFYIDFKRFVLFSTLSRGSRFFLEAVFVIFYGQRVLEFFSMDSKLFCYSSISVSATLFC